MSKHESAAFVRCLIRIGMTLLLVVLVASCATAPSASRSSSARLERNKPNHPWLDAVIGSPDVSEQQFDELPWWQQITAGISVMFLEITRVGAVQNSERELK